jgi:hypothetical protein
LGIGTASQVLSVSGGVPAWTTPAAGGGLTLIATATPSAATTISFTSIPSDYKHLMLIWRDTYSSSTTGGHGVRLNNDTAADRHSYRNLGLISSSTVARDTGTGTLFTSDSTERMIIPRQNNSSSRSLLGYGTFTVYRYTESEPKFCEWTGSGDVGSSFGNGQFEGTAAITRIDFVRSASQTINGTFYLYGVS